MTSQLVIGTKLPFFCCLHRGVHMPITRTVWRGKVEVRNFGAYDEAVPITSVCTTLDFLLSSQNYHDSPIQMRLKLVMDNETWGCAPTAWNEWSLGGRAWVSYPKIRFKLSSLLRMRSGTATHRKESHYLNRATGPIYVCPLRSRHMVHCLIGRIDFWSGVQR